MEYRFRAWDKRHQQMFYDVAIHNGGFCVHRSDAKLINISGTICEQSSIVIMQSTGLDDKKGTEIFDHDYIQNATGRICEVIWNEFHGCWDATVVKMVQGDSQDGFICAQWAREVTVVGNSLANPEILEVQK